MLRRPVVVMLVGLTVLAGCGGGSDETAAGGGAETSAPTTTAALTTTAAPTTTAEPTTETTSPPPADDGGSGQRALPDAVGLDLQYAQDTMQAAGFFFLTSHDATGQDRFQILDRNWKVCDQSPPGGTPAGPATEIDFGAVKDDETCPPT